MSVQKILDIAETIEAVEFISFYTVPKEEDGILKTKKLGVRGIPDALVQKNINVDFLCEELNRAIDVVKKSYIEALKSQLKQEVSRI